MGGAPVMTDYRNIILHCTCAACPEQYEAYNSNGKQVGYLRLRHGVFEARVPNNNGSTVFEVEVNGDGLFDPDEREPRLRQAIDALLAHSGEQS